MIWSIKYEKNSVKNSLEFSYRTFAKFDISDCYDEDFNGNRDRDLYLATGF